MSSLGHRFRFALRALQSVAEYGLLRAFPLAAFEFLYEFKLHAKTAGVVLGDELFDDPSAREHGHIYVPCPYYLMARAFRLLDVRALEGTFVDYGCGMGRVLLFASQYPFRRIVGVELSEALCRTAERNLTNHCARTEAKMPDWQVIHGDATRFELPDDACVVFFNDPFDDTILEPVVRRIEGSLKRAPRPLFVIYVNPGYPEVFERHGFRETRNEVNRHNKGFVIFERSRT